jgi:hypothetical protein
LGFEGGLGVPGGVVDVFLLAGGGEGLAKGGEILGVVLLLALGEVEALFLGRFGID